MIDVCITRLLHRGKRSIKHHYNTNNINVREKKDPHMLFEYRKTKCLC